jgi:pyruvate formate lyase activating enzyme
MQTGIVFDIKEFAVHDGPGIRTTVFLKGCPLRCLWCQNPEGISLEPQTMTSPAGKRIVGQRYTSEELADLLNGQADILRRNEGGVTFSGGEPLMQAAFVAEVIDSLDNIHTLLDTAGCATADDFRLVAGKADLIYFDLKLIDPDAHRKYVGGDGKRILSNLRLLTRIGTPFVVRVPLVPGVTDTEDNLAAIAETVTGLAGMIRVDLLPYNKAAGGKYAAAGMDFSVDYDESREVNADTAPFERLGIPVRVA